MFWASVFSPTGSHYFQGALVAQLGNSTDTFSTLQRTKGKYHSKAVPRNHWRHILCFYMVKFKVYYRNRFQVKVHNSIGKAVGAECEKKKNTFLRFVVMKASKCKQQIKPYACLWNTCFFKDFRYVWWKLIYRGWYRLSKEQTLVRKEKKGEQSEMRSCDSLLCRWGESATSKLSERFLIHHCRFRCTRLCVLVTVWQSICAAATSTDWSPFRRLQERIPGAMLHPRVPQTLD